MKFSPLHRLIFISLFIVVGCSDNPTNQNEKPDKQAAPPSTFRIDVQNDNGTSTYKLGDTVQMKLVRTDSSLDLATVKFFMDNELIAEGNALQTDWKIPTGELTVGSRRFRLETTFANGQVENKFKSITLLAKKAPLQMDYQLIEDYPHQTDAYTQGFYYEDGYYYESTGLNRRSSLRYVDLKTGEIKRSHILPGEIFAEGLTVIDDKVYQISWRNRKGFVYDKNTFELINEFSYNTEGWGLTFDGQYLIMSDGSHNLYYLDRNSFSLVKTLEVYNQTGRVSQLNELEYVNGEIWANV
jgi:glutamine cyclotransferase